jgi:cytochrome c-type biogenesis protein CcmF
MWQTLPELGEATLYAILVVAAYTAAVAIAAARGRPRLLQSARLGAYATAALVGFAVLLLAYAFVTHDFRIRYVARYSDRSMTPGYLIAALWGGQDGSILWWLALLSMYSSACVAWLKGRYRELQPWIIATLMGIVGFFTITMIFAANPFWTSFAGAPPDGDGLNPQLQNFYMIIHPPSLYVGFVGCSVPFAFAVAALVTRRLDNEWIVATRKWMLFAWLFLSIGNALGMLWAYEELGWGGYWAWDPVENAACIPWFTATAYLHSTMIQERRNLFKVWNVFLICATFFLTIFGTFLTRSGLISSVHSFAQSNIGIFFVWFMGIITATSVGLIAWRWRELRSRGEVEALLSREAAFVLNNWALLGIGLFIAIATIFPKLSEWWWNESVTVGPPFFNRWLAPAGIALLVLMGSAPLLGWRKTSNAALKRAAIAPLVALVATGALHLAIGAKLGFPAIVPNDQFYPGVVGVLLKWAGAAAPLIVVSLVGFNFAVVAQEFVRGVAARRAAADKREAPEGLLTALGNLVSKSRRRYGGYVVHVGIALMFLGFTGRSWGLDHETSMRPGDRHEIGGYTLTYVGPRMEVDPDKRAIYADVEVERSGKALGKLSPAKFIYPKADGPSTEVAMLHSLREDLYLVVGSVSPQNKQATFQFHVNPLVGFIWLGVLVLMAGATLSLWPELELGGARYWAYGADDDHRVRSRAERRARHDAPGACRSGGHGGGRGAPRGAARSRGARARHRAVLGVRGSGRSGADPAPRAARCLIDACPRSPSPLAGTARRGDRGHHRREPARPRLRLDGAGGRRAARCDRARLGQRAEPDR